LYNPNSLFTGFTHIDAATQGLVYQEFGLFIGHTGAGKTAMAIYSATQNARMGRKVLYLSLEEKAENLVKRIQSNIFRIPYTLLQTGCESAQEQLKTRFKNLTDREKFALDNLKIHDLTGLQSPTADYLKNYLEALYNENGYHPDLVYIDQMEHLEPNSKSQHEWERLKNIAFEVDKLSHYLIGNQYKFSIWLLHQASGKMSWKYSNDQISGFTGIIRPCDMAIAIGRESTMDDIVKLFSLKVRHGGNFEFDYRADLQFMDFKAF
jgi:replicative DNA helicase